MAETISRARAHGHDLDAPHSLFPTDIHDRVLLSCHLLGKPTAAQLYRLHADQLSGDRAMRAIVHRLSKMPGPILSVIRPIDLNNPSRFLSHVYLDTTRSRRHLERTWGIPFRRPPELPSRDWRFLRHDVTHIDELITFELTARKRGLSFGYQSHHDDEGKPIYPRVEIAHDDLVHRLRPEPDKTLLFNGYHIIHEHDCGEETIEIGNIIRDATIARKHLVYDQLHRDGTFDRLGWQKVIKVFTVEGKKRTRRSTSKRIGRMLETIPDVVDAKTIYFIDRQSVLDAGNDMYELEYVRGDGVRTRLPCCR